MHPHPYPSSWSAEGMVRKILDGPFLGRLFPFRFLEPSFFQKTMGDKATFLCGVSFKTRFPNGEDKILVAPVSAVELVLLGDPVIGKKGKKRFTIGATIADKVYPLRFEAPPLLLVQKREIRKGKFRCNILDFSYTSNLCPTSALHCFKELTALDQKIRNLIHENQEIFFSETNLDYDDITQRYQGFTTTRKWTPPPPESGPADGFQSATIENADGDLPKLVYEVKGESKKRKFVEEDPSESLPMEFPAQLSIFPSSKKPNFCKVFTMDGKVALLTALTPGLEASPVFDVQLTEEQQKVQLSLTGLQITMKEDHRKVASYSASDVYKP